MAVVGTAVFEVPSFARGLAALALPTPGSGALALPTLGSGALALRTPGSAEVSVAVSVEVAADSILKPVTFSERP